MVDLAQALSEIKSLPDQALSDALGKKDGMIPGYLALAELHERKNVRRSAPSHEERPSMAQEYMGLDATRAKFAAGGSVQKGLVPDNLTNINTLYHDTAVNPLSLYGQAGEGGIVDLIRPGMPVQPIGLASLAAAMPGMPGASKRPQMMSNGGIVGLARGGNVNQQWVRYMNQKATRSMALDPQLEAYLQDAVTNVYGPGAYVGVYSGGQPSSGPNRTGTHRHDMGRAGDVYVYDAQGNQLRGDALAPLGQYWQAKGYGGTGMEMHGGGVHLDMLSPEQSGGGWNWNYADKGGQYTAAQAAAINAGRQGILPQMYGGGTGQNVMVGSAGGDTLGGGQPQMSIADYIKARAPVYGIDPNVALRVAKSEGGLDNILRQSDVMKNGVREPSYGPFQLYMNGGLGNRALAAGIDPRTVEGGWKGIDFALAEAGQKGWGQWYGAKRVGIGKMEGISGTGSATPVYDANMLASLANPAAATGANAANAVSQATAAGAQAAGAGAVGDGGIGDLMMLSQMFGGLGQQAQPAPVAAPVQQAQAIPLKDEDWLRQPVFVGRRAYG